MKRVPAKIRMCWGCGVVYRGTRDFHSEACRIEQGSVEHHSQAYRMTIKREMTDHEPSTPDRRTRGNRYCSVITLASGYAYAQDTSGRWTIRRSQ